jgi:hypothetical protein
MQAAVLAVCLFLLNAALNWPLFFPGESHYRDTITGGYMGMARFFAEHPNPWGWSPLQYCGLPAQFIYLPALSYGSAAISSLSGISAPYAYKLLTTSLACLGPVSVFLFVLFFTRSRIWAVATALGYTFLSPLYGLVPQIDHDRGLYYLPWRLHVFVKYGEGPHNAGLTLIPLALVAVWTAATLRRFWTIPAAALLLALIALTNWVAALGLTICILLMLLAAWTANDERPRILRVIATGLLAYGLACFWLTPEFVRTVAFNWPIDAFNYHLQRTQQWLLLGWVAGLLLLGLVMRILHWPFFQRFVWLGTFAFGYPVLIFYASNIDVLPESRRYALEFELFLVLALFAFLRFGFEGGNRVRQFCATAVLLLSTWTGWGQIQRYVAQGYANRWPLPAESTSEFRVAKWLADHDVRGRILATGGLRFRLNQWFDLPQVGGVFESGLHNRVPVDFAYQIRTGRGSRPGEETGDALRKMQALGVEYVVIHGSKSAEHYRDYRNPDMFEGVLERVYSEGDDRIYRVPFRSLAHTAAHRDLETRWDGTSALEVRGPVPAGHDVVVAVTNENGWVATQGGTKVPVESNKLGFMVVKARPSSDAAIRLEYRGTVEQRVMAVLSLLVWGGMTAWLWRGWRIHSRK